MSELVPCTATGCQGGFVITPKVGLDNKGEPIMWQEMTTCIVCHGNGMVER